MRALPIAACLSAMFAGAVWAQNPDLDRLRIRALQQQNMQAQEQQNVLRRGDADVAQALSDQNRAATQANLRASRPVTAAITPSVEPERIADDAETLRRLQDGELAAGNARLREIAPAAR